MFTAAICVFLLLFFRGCFSFSWNSEKTIRNKTYADSTLNVLQYIQLDNMPIISQIIHNHDGVLAIIVDERDYMSDKT